MNQDNKFHIGQRVRIKRSAFPDSDDPDERAARGKEGIIFQEPTDKGDGWTVAVNIGSRKEMVYVYDNEMEPLS